MSLRLEYDQQTLQVIFWTIKVLCIFRTKRHLKKYVKTLLKYNTLRKESTSLTKCIGKWPRKQSIPNFPKNEHFLPPDMHLYVCISGGKKCSFFGKLDVLWCACYLRFAIHPFALILTYWQLQMFLLLLCFTVQLECNSRMQKQRKTT